METRDILESSERLIKLSERIERLTRYPEWKDFLRVLDELISNETKALLGQDLDKDYYRRIAFIQTLHYVKAIPSVIKDRKVREYLFHQGRLNALTKISNISSLFRKIRKIEEGRIRQMINGTPTQSDKKSFHEETFASS